MKLLKGAVVVLAVIGMIACLSTASFAAEKMYHKNWQEMCQAKIKALKDSAALLQGTNPDMAKSLTDLATQKEMKLKEMTEKKAKEEANEKLLRDSAAALQKANPDLAKELWDMSEHKHMGKMMGKDGCPMCKMGRDEEEEEHEEAGE